MSKSEEILLKFFKTPFDEEDAQKIVNSENAIKSCTEVTIIWAMLEAAKILGQEETMRGVLDGSIELVEEEPIEEEDEEEDLL